ncbi:MAG: fatty acid--CoA ligase family protein [Myxococcota bacterium]
MDVRAPKVPTLRERLAARAPVSEVLPGLRTDALLAEAADAPDVLPSVALRVRDVRTFVRALSVLDGRAETILLASPGTPLETVRAQAERAGCTHVFGPGADLETLAELRALGQPGAAPPTRWVLTTSGTTAEPKLVGHTLGSLTRTTTSDATRGRTATWGLLYEPTRYAGLQVVLQSLLGGSRLVAPDPGAPLHERVAVLAVRGCTHLSATPTLWRRLLMTARSEELPLRQITLGGEIADQTLLDRLTNAFPGARIAHIFASTEAGVGFSVTDGKAGFPAAFLEVPPAGIAIRVREGRLLVRNEAVAGAYLGEGTRFRDDEGFVDTGDAVELRGERVLFLGRASGVINVGGQKVHPERVEAVLVAHPGVAVAKVGQRRSPITGALVMAEVQPAPGTDPAALKRELRAHCAALLAPYERPASVKVTGRLATNGAGKIVRRGEAA